MNKRWGECINPSAIFQIHTFAARQAVARCLFADAERAEDQVQDVIGGGGAGDFIQRSQSIVEVEQEHFVRDFVVDGGFRGFERSQRVAHEALVADTGEKTALGMGADFSADVAKNLGAKLRNAFSGESGGADSRSFNMSLRG